MERFDWPSLLQEINDHILGDKTDAWIEADHCEQGYLGYRGASEAQILAAENRLGARFPPSYRAFLTVSNGWGAMGAGCPGKLWSTVEIEWLAVRN